MIHDFIKEKVLRFVRSETPNNDIEVVVTSGVCEIGSYIVYVNTIKAKENLEYLY